MPKLVYRTKKFGPDAIAIIDQAGEIITDYAAQGFDLTLRQLYYQFVARGLLANQDRNYKRLGDIISDARMAGLIDWSAIEDRTRDLKGVGTPHSPTWRDPPAIINGAARGYAEDLWKDQPYYIECWVEKEALAGVVEHACNPLRVPFFSCRGYVSQSEMWVASQRLLKKIEAGKKVLVLHLGDHDPSGVDMTRDINDRLRYFLTVDTARSNRIELYQGSEEPIADYVERCADLVDNRFEINRLALNMEQVEQYNPPPNPAKLTDSRCEKYIEQYGDESWELDALEPSALSELIETAVLDVRDDERWTTAEEHEQKNTETLEAVRDRWTEVAALVKP